MIEAIVGEEIDFRRIYPEADRATIQHDRESTGCLAVKKWCEKLDNNFLSLYFEKIKPITDVIIVHLDADVAGRRDFQRWGAKECKCPPAISTGDSVRELVKKWIGYDKNDDLFNKIIIVVPSKATEAWLGIIDNGLFIDECTQNPAEVLVSVGKLTDIRDEKGKLIKTGWTQQFKAYAKKHFVNNLGQSISKLEGVSEEARNFIVAVRNALVD